MRGLGELLGEGAFDLVITNPPYRTVESSPPSPNPSRALAFNEIALRLAEWVEAAARAVRTGGRVAAILPATRAEELRRALLKGHLRPIRTRFVCPRAGEPPSRVMVEARRDLGEAFVIEFVVEAPLIVHGPDGDFTPEVRRMLGETA